MIVMLTGWLLRDVELVLAIVALASHRRRSAAAGLFLSGSQLTAPLSAATSSSIRSGIASYLGVPTSAVTLAQA